MGSNPASEAHQTDQPLGVKDELVSRGVPVPDDRVEAGNLSAT